MMMVDREKVTKGFECCHVMMHDLRPEEAACGICPYKDAQAEGDLGEIACIAALHDDTLAMLKEKEPKPVIFDRQCCVGPGQWERKGFCPKCHQVVLWMTNRKYCGFCGQEVKWE